MSLHTLANHLQQAGRGQDKVLVHMTPKEVHGLQALAMAHGGSLSINPKTGLPEAGFLSSILPMVAGVALGPAGIGLSAMQAGLAAGAIGTVATGSLKKGILAGLGAYGGAGLSAGLAGVGPAAATSGFNAANAASMVAPAGTPFTMPAASTIAATPATAATLPTATGAAAGTPFGMAAPVNPAVTPQATVMPQGAAPTNINVAGQPDTSTFMGRMKAIGQNIGKLTGGSEDDSQYRKQFWQNYKPEIISSGLSLLAQQQEEAKKEQKKKFDPNYRAYSPSYFEEMYGSSREPGGTSERRYFVKNGGLLSLANGGPVETMSQLNAVGNNTGYPMANQQTSRYSMYEMPVPQNIVGVQGDSNVDTYTGELKMADGGTVNQLNSTMYGTTQSKPKDKNIVETYNYRDPITGEYKNIAPEETFTPLSKIPGLSKTVKRITKDDVIQVFGRYGMTPTEEDFKKLVDNKYSLEQVANIAKKSPQWGTKKNWTADEVTNYFQSVWGMPPTPQELAKFTNPKNKYNVAQLYDYAKKQPEYLQNINKNVETQFNTAKTGKEAAKVEEQRTKSPLDVMGIASTFQDVLGRAPSWEELQSFKGKPFVAGDLKTQLQSSPEFEKKLTQPFVPKMEFDEYGRGSIAGVPAYKTPEQKLGLEGFYQKMNTELANQGGYPAPPPPLPPMKPRVEPPPEPILYNDPAAKAMAEAETAAATTQPEIDPITGLPIKTGARGGMMGAGGISHLGDYSDGGRLLKGPGDGVSDSIPASIGDRQPARLADGEFVIPARIVSEIGNGSTDAGARKLYAMMDRIQKARSKSIGKGKVAVNSKADKYLPA